MSSHADQHDLDKLGRWHRDLSGSPHSGFPVYAIFLVSVDDRVAHDIFRKFRSSFEARNAGFENLVIFGQHGLSITAQRLLSEFGLSQDFLPLLALIDGADTGSVCTIPLPSGADESMAGTGQGEEDWQKALSAVEASTAEGKGLRLDAVQGLLRHKLDDGPLGELVGRLLRDLS